VAQGGWRGLGKRGISEVEGRKGVPLSVPQAMALTDYRRGGKKGPTAAKWSREGTPGVSGAAQEKERLQREARKEPRQGPFFVSICYRALQKELRRTKNRGVPGKKAASKLGIPIGS